MADKAIEKGQTKRYLPEKAWASLSKEERTKTDEKKKEIHLLDQVILDLADGRLELLRGGYK